MGPLRYSINVTLDGCVDHQVMIPDEELHRSWGARSSGRGRSLCATSPVESRLEGLAVSIPWLLDDAEPNADMWAMPDETRERIVELL